jgi:hypothetical protein
MCAAQLRYAFDVRKLEAVSKGRRSRLRRMWSCSSAGNVSNGDPKQNCGIFGRPRGILTTVGKVQDIRVEYSSHHSGDGGG